MHRRPLPLVLAVLQSMTGLCAQSPPNGGPMPLPVEIAAQMDRPAEAYAEAQRASAATLLADFEKELRQICRDGRLPIDERVRRATELAEQRAKFARDCTEPKAEVMASALARHQKRVASGRTLYERAIDRIAEAYLGSDRELTKAILAEKQRVTTTKVAVVDAAGPSDPRAIDASLVELLAADSLPEHLPAALEPRAQMLAATSRELTEVRGKWNAGLAALRKDLLAEFAAAEARVLKDAKLAVEERVAQTDRLHAECDASMQSLDLSAVTTLPAETVSRYTRRLATHQRKTRSLFETAAARSIDENLDVARSILVLRDTLVPGAPISEGPLAPVPSDEAARVAQAFAGRWSIDGDTLVQSGMRERQLTIAFGNAVWSEYDFSVDCRLDTGKHGFKVLFHHRGQTTFREFQVGGYENCKADSSSWIDGRWTCAPGTQIDHSIEAGRWYAMRIEVRGGRARCFLDEQLMFEAVDERLTSGRVGLGCWGTSASFRNLIVRTPAGEPIWTGLPTLP